MSFKNVSFSPFFLFLNSGFKPVKTFFKVVIFYFNTIKYIWHQRQKHFFLWSMHSSDFLTSLGSRLNKKPNFFWLPPLFFKDLFLFTGSTQENILPPLRSCSNTTLKKKVNGFQDLSTLMSILSLVRLWIKSRVNREERVGCVMMDIRWTRLIAIWNFESAIWWSEIEMILFDNRQEQWHEH